MTKQEQIDISRELKALYKQGKLTRRTLAVALETVQVQAMMEALSDSDREAVTAATKREKAPCDVSGQLPPIVQAAIRAAQPRPTISTISGASKSPLYAVAKVVPIRADTIIVQSQKDVPSKETESNFLPAAWDHGVETEDDAS